MQVIETGCLLLLRYFHADDAWFIVRLLNEPSFKPLEKVGLTFERMIRMSGDEAELKFFVSDTQ